MVKMCECCRNVTREDSAAFCTHCGNKFPEDESVLLRQIRDSVEESRREIVNIRNLVRKSQKKPNLANNLLIFAIIIILVIVIAGAILFLKPGIFF
jgi:uncharacterized membrane protein YvbJ